MGQDKLPFHVVTYFLVSKLTPSGQLYADWLKKLKSCFPCMDMRMESEFRKIAADFLSSLEKETDFRLQKKLPFSNILMYPGKEVFLHVYLKLTNFVVTKLTTSGGRMVIRSYKSHNHANHLIRPLISSLTQSHKDEDAARMQLKSVAGEYENMFTQYSNDRVMDEEAVKSADAEMISLFSEQDETDDTCFVYVNHVIDLQNRPLLSGPDLTQSLVALSDGNERKSLLSRCSAVDAVTRIKLIADFAKQILDQLRKGKFIQVM
jgi:hypothetical protein